MNRTDRLLAIVLELQGKGKQRAEDLAATFEVSKRTIYRDIEALSQAGVPVAAAPGQGYRLVPGYFLPPLSFSADEAIMLLLGSQVMSESFDAQYKAASESAGRKIAGVLPESLRDEVGYLQSSIRFINPDANKRSGEATTLQQVRRAIIERQTVQFSYYARYRQPDKAGVHGKKPRKADPYGLVNVAGNWYMVARDHNKGDIRSFKLERIEGLVVLAEPFTRPVDFKLQQGPQEDRIVEVRALFSEEVARWVLEAPSYYTVAAEQTAEGLVVTLMVRHEQEVLQWLLSWGRHVRVLSPASLSAALAQEAKLVAEIHENSDSLLT